MTAHSTPHPLAGQTVSLNNDTVDHADELHPGDEFRVEDYWDRVSGQSWMDSAGNPACLKFAMRWGLSGNPRLDDEVVYGKDKAGLGHLVHVSELGEAVSR